MPPEHAITALPGVPGLSLSCGACLLPLGHVSGSVHGVDLEFFLLPPSPRLTARSAEPRRGGATETGSLVTPSSSGESVANVAFGGGTERAGTPSR